MKILITDTMYCAGTGREAAAWIEENLGQVITNPLGRKMTAEDIRSLWDGVDVIIAGTEEYNRELILSAPDSLKMIARNGVSCENVDLDAAHEKKIVVTTVRGANSAAVADGTMALLLAVARRLPQTDGAVREGVWNGPIADDVNHKVLGILGFGAIGKLVARRARAFDMTVLAYSPPGEFDEAFAAQYGIQKSDLGEILQCSDFVTLHMPVLPETQSMINRETLSKMKPTAYLINTSRGALVQEADLIEALKNGTIRGAALDVFEQEPLMDSPLLGMDNVVLSPHCAGLSKGAIWEMAKINIENIRAAAQGVSLRVMVAGPFQRRWE